MRLPLNVIGSELSDSLEIREQYKKNIEEKEAELGQLVQYAKEIPSTAEPRAEEEAGRYGVSIGRQKICFCIILCVYINCLINSF